MSRKAKGARLELIKRKARASIWYIRDTGCPDKSTGCVESELEQAKLALARYQLEKHDPSRKSESDPHQTAVVDCLNVYLNKVVRQPEKNPMIVKAGEGRISKLEAFFGGDTVKQVTGQRQIDFAEQRGSQSAARRELEDLSAAINYFFASTQGGLNMLFVPWLPEKSQPRERFIDRNEAAKLIWAAWRMRSAVRGGKSEGRYTGKHLARFILVGLYTGTRCKAVCNAATMPTIGRGYIDYERGLFYRKAKGVRATSKRQPTCSIPPRLLIHMRRWKRLGISDHSVIEWQGKAIGRLNKSFNHAVGLAELGREVIPHTLRHTSITWYCERIGVVPEEGSPPLTVEDVSEFVGVSVAELNRTYRHVMPSANKAVLKASYAFGKSRAR